jgi:hypothetical protein
MRKTTLFALISVLMLPLIYGEELVSVKKSFNAWFYISIAIIVLISFIFLKKLDFNIRNIAASFKPTKWKLLASLIVWFGYTFCLLIMRVKLLCKECAPSTSPCTIDYGRFMINKADCHCGCYSFSEFMSSYIYLLIPIVVIYAIVCVFAVLIKRQDKSNK